MSITINKKVVKKSVMVEKIASHVKFLISSFKLAKIDFRDLWYSINKKTWSFFFKKNSIWLIVDTYCGTINIKVTKNTKVFFFHLMWKILTQFF